MNILILNWRDPKNPKAGGAEYVTREHARAWIKKGNSVTWFTTMFPQARIDETIDGIIYIRKGNSATVFFQAALFYLSSKRRFDIVIDQIHGLPFFTPLYVRGPKIAFIHEVASEIWDYVYPFPWNILGKLVEKLSFRLYKATPFWTDAPSTIDDLEKMGIPRSHCTAIPCPIDNKPLQDVPDKEKTPTFIFVSRLTAMKGVEDVIRAFSYIKKKESNARLWIVGQGENKYITRLKRIVKADGLTSSVVFWGYVPSQKKLELMKRAHILLHGSVKEGWGLVVLEAASQATPTVAFAVPGLRDVIVHEKTGVLVFGRNKEVFADSAIILLQDKERLLKMQRRCLRYAASFSWDEETKKSLQLLQKEYKK